MKQNFHLGVLLVALALLVGGAAGQARAEESSSEAPEGPAAVDQVKEAVRAYFSANDPRQTTCAPVTENFRRQEAELDRLMSQLLGLPDLWLSCEQWAKELAGLPPIPPDERKLRGAEITAQVSDGTATVSLFEKTRSGRSKRAISDLSLRYLDGRWLIDDLGREYRGFLARGRHLVAEKNKVARLDCRRFRLLAGHWERADKRSSRLPTARQRLADAIVKCRVLANRTRREVVGILGRPDRYEARRGQASWVTGEERHLLGIGREVLLVSFDRRRRVRSVKLEPDWPSRGLGATATH